MLYHLSNSLSLTTAALHLRPLFTTLSIPPPPLLSKSLKYFHTYPFKSHPRPSPLLCDVVPAMNNNPDLLVDSVADELKKQKLSGDEDVRVKLRKSLDDLTWDHSFVRELPGNPRTDIIPREVCRFDSIAVFC